jgi:glutathione gamma-glutamylcysteinyltransferase
MNSCTALNVTNSPGEEGVYMRPLPAGLEALSSGRGRALFTEALLEGTMDGYFRLAQQFHTQADPAFCGLGTLVCALNALEIEPARRWKGIWRWFSEELLDCCKSLEDVRRYGLTLDEVACLARCSGASVTVQAGLPAQLDLFREHLLESVTSGDGPVLVANYSRRALGQTGDGHFSPIGGFHAATDQVLVLDTARFKYPPHWVPVDLLFRAMQEEDPVTRQPRGWLLLQRQGERAGDAQAAAPNGEAISKKSPRIITEGGIPNIW